MTPDDYWKTILLILTTLTIAYIIMLYQLIGN